MRKQPGFAALDIRLHRCYGREKAALVKPRPSPFQLFAPMDRVYTKFGIDHSFCLDPFSGSLFILCGRRVDRIKALYWDSDGFVLLYK